MPKHTQGPWVVESADWWKKDNAVVRYYVRHDPPEINALNARLIAAAPDYWDAAERLSADASELDGDDAGYVAVRKDAFDALMAAHRKAGA